MDLQKLISTVRGRMASSWNKNTEPQSCTVMFCIRYRGELVYRSIRTTKAIAEGLTEYPINSAYFRECFTRVAPRIKAMLIDNPRARERSRIDVNHLVSQPVLVGTWEKTGQYELTGKKEKRSWEPTKTITRCSKKKRKKSDPTQGKLF